MSFRKSLIICGFWCVCVCVIACVCVHELVCVFRRVLLVLCLPVCVAKAWHDPGSLGNKPFEARDLVPYKYHVIWPLFRKMPVNQKTLNRIGIFWYYFTPRKLLYLMISVNLVKFGHIGFQGYVFFLAILLSVSLIYTERQKKLITFSEWHSLKSTASKWFIFGHRLGQFILNKHIRRKKSLLQSKRR